MIRIVIGSRESRNNRSYPKKIDTLYPLNAFYPIWVKEAHIRILVYYGVARLSTSSNQTLLILGC